MGDSSPHSPRLCLSREFNQDTVPKAKRLSDSTAQLQALQSAKRVCALSHVCSTPKPPENLLLLSPGSPCSHFLDDSGQGNLAAGFCGSAYDDVAISLDTSRCFDDTELDDSLLELSGSEKGNSPFDYTEEEIQEILADDCMEAEQHLIRQSHPSQSVNEESGEAESSSGASLSEGASEIAEEPLPQEHFPVSSGCYPGFLSGSADLGGVHLQQQDLDLQDLLRLSPFAAGGSSEPLEGSYLVEVEREALEAMIEDCLGYATTAGSCSLEESLEPEDQESLALDCLGRSVPLSHLGQSSGDESPAPGSGNKELPKTTASSFSWKSDSPEGGEGESPGAEQPSGNIKLSDTTMVQTVQQETTSGKQPGKVILAPQEKEKSLKQQPCISEVKTEQKKRFHPECAHPHDGKCPPYVRNYPRSTKKPAQRCSHAHWVSKNLTKLHDFQSIPDHFQCNPV